MSDPVAPEVSLDERVEDLRAVMDAAGIARTFLCGISDGGAPSIGFAVRYPERTCGLILIDSWPRVVQGDGYPIGLTREQYASLLDAWVERWGTPRSLSLPLFVASRKDDAEFARWGGRYERQCNSPGTFRRLMQMTAELDIRPQLGELRCPVLVLHRRDDPAISVEHGRYLARHIPGAAYHELDGIDHVPWEGDSARVIELVREFVDEVSRREASRGERTAG